MDKYFVVESNREYQVIFEDFDNNAGNFYNTIASRIETKEKAKLLADMLNKYSN